MQQTDYERRGYLHEDFRLFHLSSALAEDTAFHYHEFHKLVFFWPGAGTTSSRDARTRCGRMTWCLCGRGRSTRHRSTRVSVTNA